tara:strand:+ start:8236 stop:8694 length:459 start_codon:yes stop_codon:yes gene_type:complete
MDNKVDKHSEVFKVLLLIAFSGQLLFDGLGMAGFFYRSFSDEIFFSAGAGAMIPLGMSFSLYIFFMLFFYSSIIAMSLGHWIAWLLVPLALGISFIMQILSGVGVWTPAELTISWIVWFSYNVSLAMMVFARKVSARFRSSFRRFYNGISKP